MRKVKILQTSEDTGPLSINGKVLTYKGKQLRASALKPGSVVTFNPVTGEIHKITIRAEHRRHG
jgi:hypothetical protein